MGHDARKASQEQGWREAHRGAGPREGSKERGATFSRTEMKNPPVSEWCGRMRMQRCRLKRCESSPGNMLLVSLLEPA